MYNRIKEEGEKILKWNIYSRNLPIVSCLETVTRCWTGIFLAWTRVTSICRSLALGRGTERYIKGSKDTEMCEHCEQMIVFLNWPWKVCARTVEFKDRYFSQYLSASIASLSRAGSRAVSKIKRNMEFYIKFEYFIKCSQQLINCEVITNFKRNWRRILIGILQKKKNIFLFSVKRRKQNKGVKFFKKKPGIYFLTFLSRFLLFPKINWFPQFLHKKASVEVKITRGRVSQTWMLGGGSNIYNTSRIPEQHEGGSVWLSSTSCSHSLLSCSHSLLSCSHSLLSVSINTFFSLDSNRILFPNLSSRSH